MLVDRSTVRLSTATVALISTKCFERFSPNDRDHAQGSHRIRPPPADGCVENETGKSDRRQIRAERRLRGFGAKGVAGQSLGDASLRSGEQWHDDDGCGGECDADETRVRRLAKPERLAAV